MFSKAYIIFVILYFILELLLIKLEMESERKAIVSHYRVGTSNVVIARFFMWQDQLFWNDLKKEVTFPIVREVAGHAPSDLPSKLKPLEKEFTETLGVSYEK